MSALSIPGPRSRAHWSGTFTRPLHGPLPWVAAVAVGVVHYLMVVVDALESPLQRFDQGILLSATRLSAHGQFAIADFYIPYGWGLGVFGAPAQWLFGGQALAVHLVFATAIALLTALAFVVGA